MDFNKKLSVIREFFICLFGSFSVIIKLNYMITNNFLLSILQVFARFIAGVIFFPFWWYSVGFGRFLTKVFRFWQEEQRILGFSVWLKNIFVPMYGQHDFSGRLISFFIRLFQVIFRGLALLFWALLCLALIIFWLLLPLLLLAAIAFQLSS